MSSIAKKRSSVKGGKRQKKPLTEPKKAKKKPSQPRYTLKKDSLGRRYAIDKRTGRRVSVSTADKERKQRRKAAVKAKELFRGITPPKRPKQPKRRVTKKTRSQSAKKGWETRRKRETQKEHLAPLGLGREIGAFAIPENMRVLILNGVADRAESYPKIKAAADLAFSKLQIDFHIRQVALLEDQTPPEPTPTPRFDRMYGAGMGQLVRDRLAGAMDLQDIDQLVEELADDPDYDFTTRELYTLYFSPEAA